MTVVAASWRVSVRSRLKFLLKLVFLLWMAGAQSAASPKLVDQDTSQLLSEAQALYNQKFKETENLILLRYKIQYSEYISKYQDQLLLYRDREAQVYKEKNRSLRITLLKKLQQDFPDAEMKKAAEIFYVFQNEMERDHAFTGNFLSKLEKVLEKVIQEDDFFRWIFVSSEFRNRYGLVLREVVWQIEQGSDLSGQTVPLNVHSFFLDNSKTPILVKLSPQAFKSLPFLRSILMHEANHVLMFKHPLFRNAEIFSGPAVRPAEGPYSHYFSKLNPSDMLYQFYLVHEYYGFQTQLLMSEVCGKDPKCRLEDRHQVYFQKALEWTFHELNSSNQGFVKKHPEPPAVRLWKQIQNEERSSGKAIDLRLQ